MYTNIQGIINNFNQLEIIASNETHQTDEIDDSEIEIEIENYDHNHSLLNSCSGVIIYLKKHWSMKKLKKILRTINIGLVYIWLNLKKNTSRIIMAI